MHIKHVLFPPIVAMLLVACGGDKTHNNHAATSASTSASASTPQSAEVIKIGIGPVYPPYIQPATNSGEFTGYDIDLLKTIAEKEGFQVSFTPYPWASLFDSLNNSEMDIIAGGISVREERKILMDFTDTYDENMMVAIVPKDSPVQTIHDLRDKAVYYQKNSAEASTFQTLTQSKLDPQLGTDTAWLSVKAVIDAADTKADAAVGQLSTLEYYNNQYKDQGLKIIYPENQPVEFMAFAVKKGNTALLEKLNAGFAKLKADGTLEQIHDKWSQHKMSNHISTQQNTATSTVSASHRH